MKERRIAYKISVKTWRAISFGRFRRR